MATILVTGATGTVGSCIRVLQQALQQQLSFGVFDCIESHLQMGYGDTSIPSIRLLATCDMLKDDVTFARPVSL